MKLIDQYISAKKDIDKKLTEGKLPVQGLLELQELNYRIDVLDTLKSVCASAPLSTDAKTLCVHYSLASGYIKSFAKDHQIGVKADDELKGKRETSNEALQRVIEDGCKRFSSFKAAANEDYKTALGKFVGNVLTVWVQYRNTYVKIGG